MFSGLWFSKEDSQPPAASVLVPNLEFLNKNFVTPKLSQLFVEQLPELRLLVDAIQISNACSLEEEDWCNDACLLRYLRAEKGSIERSSKRINETLLWRREFKPHKQDLLEMEEECKAGRVYLNGFDKLAQPIMYMICRKNGTEDHMRGLKWSIYLLEQAIKQMIEGVETVSIVVDYSNLNPLKNKTPMYITKLWIDTMRDHYPERLGASFMVNPGIMVWIFFKSIGFLLDPVTRSKVNFVDVVAFKSDDTNLKASNEALAVSAEDSTITAKEIDDLKPINSKSAGWGDYVDIFDFIDRDDLERSYGGNLDFGFQHETYWKTLMENSSQISE